jgi:hypothetical protein
MVVDDPAEAARLVAEGESVVLLIDAGAGVVWPMGPGRLAVFIGPTQDPECWKAAQSMWEELFGPR